MVPGDVRAPGDAWTHEGHAIAFFGVHGPTFEKGTERTLETLRFVQFHYERTATQAVRWHRCRTATDPAYPAAP